MKNKRFFYIRLHTKYLSNNNKKIYYAIVNSCISVKEIKQTRKEREMKERKDKYSE